MSTVIRSVYDGHEHERGFESVNPSMTQQHFKAECDINVIMARYEQTGLLVDPLIAGQGGTPLFDDFSDLPDLMTAQNKLIEAQQLFESLPSRIRKDFDNDPVAFVEFCQNPDNEDKLRDYGLLPKIYTRADGMRYYFRDGQPYYLPAEEKPEIYEPVEPPVKE